jgi:hypothetical protein
MDPVHMRQSPASLAREYNLMKDGQGKKVCLSLATLSRCL